MRVLLDACVLYPTVLREILVGCAQAGLYEARLSPRILEEWARAARRRGGEADEAIARGEIASLRAAMPGAEVQPRDERGLWLPDEDDIHVLAAALASHADAILTWNAADFPRGVLAEHGLMRLDPDHFLTGLAETAPDTVAAVVDASVATASRLSGKTWTRRSLLKKARLPRLAKRL